MGCRLFSRRLNDCTLPVQRRRLFALRDLFSPPPARRLFPVWSFTCFYKFSWLHFDDGLSVVFTSFKLLRPVGTASSVVCIVFKVVAHNTERVVVLRLCCSSQTCFGSYTGFHWQLCPTVNSGFWSLTWTRRDVRGPDLKFGWFLDKLKRNYVH